MKNIKSLSIVFLILIVTSCTAINSKKVKSQKSLTSKELLPLYKLAEYYKKTNKETKELETYYLLRKNENNITKLKNIQFEINKLYFPLIQLGIEQKEYKKSLILVNDILEDTLKLKNLTTKEYMENIFRLYTDKATILKLQRKLKKSLKYYLQCLTDTQKITPKTKEEKQYIPLVIGSIYYNIAQMYYLNKEYHQALTYYRLALKKNININQRKEESILIYKKILHKNEEFFSLRKESISFLFKLMQITNLHEKILKDIQHHNYRNALSKINIKLKAFKYFKQEEPINVLYSLSYLNKLKAEVYLSNLDIANSYHFYQKAYFLSKDMIEKIKSKSYSSKDVLKLKTKRLLQISYYQENYQQAYHYASTLLDILLYENLFQANKSKSLFNYIEEQIFGSRVTENKSPMLNSISLILSTAYAYKHSLKTSKKVAKEIDIKTTTQWLSYKGIDFTNENKIYRLYEKTQNQKIKSKISKLKKLKVELNKLYTNQISSKEDVEKINIKSNQIHQIENELLTKNKEQKNISSKQISSLLSKNELYIDIASGSQNYYIFTINSQNKVTFEKISKEDTLKLNQILKNFRESHNQLIKAIETKKFTSLLNKKLIIDSKKKLSDLNTILIQKYLSKQIENKTSLIISPDGLLNFLPFEALYHNGKYLIEDYTISYISSSREFVRQARQKEQTSSNQVVVFGSPNFEFGIEDDTDKVKSVPSSFRKNSYGSLNSSQEINVIKKYYNNVKVYEKNNATVENLMQVRKPKILHLSTHGFFFDDESIKNPMMRSGLALASANRAEYEDNFSGLVTALKLSSMELYGTQLVVLSACETGLGKIYNAEGVAGLPKAFIQAGAKKVMMSLWKVSEQKTATLMENFYKHIAKGEDYASALRNAKLEMLTLHPFFWSGFVMNGV